MTPVADIGPLPFSWWSVVLNVTQAVLVLLPAAGLPLWAHRYAGRSWSLVLPLSISVVVALLAVLPGAAVGLTWLALVATPLLAAATLGWGAHGARPWLAVLAVPAFVAAVGWEGERAGQVGALLITALSCVALARLLVGAVDSEAAGRVARLLPATAWVRVALVAMAAIDAVLVFSGGLQEPNRALNAAVPAAELPRLQFVQIGTASMGYGDVFVAAVLGALLAAEGASRRAQATAALATLGLTTAFDLLFWVQSTLPATVPVAVAVLLFGGWRGPARRADDDAAFGGDQRPVRQPGGP